MDGASPVSKPLYGCTDAEQLEYIQFLTKTAHDAGLGIGCKNNVKMIKERPSIVNDMDFVIAEKCAQYNQCDAYQPFIDAGKATWAVEYDREISCQIPGMQVSKYESLNVDYKNVREVCYTPK